MSIVADGAYQHNKELGHMKISEWLDKQETQGVDVSHIVLPKDLSYDEDPDQTLYFKEIRPCTILCTQNHPFATVERFGHWYFSRGQDKQAGIHATGMNLSLFTKDKDLAVRTAKSQIE